MCGWLQVDLTPSIIRKEGAAEDVQKVTNSGNINHMSTVKFNIHHYRITFSQCQPTIY